MENKLVDSIYDVTVDPQNYENFIDRWTEQFMSFSSDAAEGNDDKITENSKKISDAIETHILTAYDILGMVDHDETGDSELKQLYELSPLPTLFISYDKKITISNIAAKNIFEINDQTKITDLDFFSDNMQVIEDLLVDLATLEADKILTIIQLKQNEDTKLPIFAISKKIEQKTAKCFLKLSAVNTVWNQEVGRTIQNRFELTNAEIDIAQKLVVGKKLTEIADEKNRSILTVRTQSKSLLKKTKLKDQSELIQLFTILQNFETLDKDLHQSIDGTNSKKSTNTKNKHFLIRENGRKLYYEIYGHPAGKPTLFMHSLVTGTDFTAENINYLHHHKIKLIAPHRASFGFSDPYLMDDLLFQFVEDIKAILDAEKVKECKLIGHAMGSFYAYYLGAHLGDRIKAIRIVSGAVPFTKIAHINELHKRQRILTYTGKYTPNLLPFLIKGSAMQLKKYGADDLLDAIYGDSGFDYKLIGDPKYRQILLNGFETSFRQGAGSIINDAKCLYSNCWDKLVASCKAPIILCHGGQNKAVPIQQVYDFVDVHHNLTLNIIDGGQLILYKYIEQVLADF